LGQDFDGNKRYARLITFRDLNDAEPIAARDCQIPPETALEEKVMARRRLGRVVVDTSVVIRAARAFRQPHG
jgi:hypothetical protein